MVRRSMLPVVFALALMAFGGARAVAVPVFAQRYGVSCETCHTIVPRLNRFGESFRAAGFRWPSPRKTFVADPLTAKVNLAYTSTPDPSGLPKAMVDEVEFLLMAPAGSHLNYRVEQYTVDGGVPGKTRDAYVEYNSDPLAAWRGSARPVFDVVAGEFTLPLPDDPETQRPTQNHYAVFDQTVGNNPFNLFDDRIGVNLGLGTRSAQLNLLVVNGHDPQSGLPTRGVDTMAVARIGAPELAFYAYRYAGTRPLGIVSDAFERSAVALSSISGKARSSLLVQTGYDSSADGLGGGQSSSGGYAQEEWAFSSRLIGVARYDGTSAAGSFARSATFSLVMRPYDRVRLTIEDVFTTQPHTAHTLNAALLFAY